MEKKLINQEQLDISENKSSFDDESKKDEFINDPWFMTHKNIYDRHITTSLQNEKN